MMNLQLPVNLIKSEDQLKKGGNQTSMVENKPISHKNSRTYLFRTSYIKPWHIEMERSYITKTEIQLLTNNNVWELVKLATPRKEDSLEQMGVQGRWSTTKPS